MNKKLSGLPLKVSTPKSATRSTRTLSNVSSALSSESPRNVPFKNTTKGVPRNPGGKQNAQKNNLVQESEKKQQNAVKGIKKIREKIVNPTKELAKNEPITKQSAAMTKNNKNQQGGFSQVKTKSTKSLLGRNGKRQVQTKKLQPVSFHKSTPKGQQKKTPQGQSNTNKSENQLSFYTIHESNLQSQNQMSFSVQNTPTIQKPALERADSLKKGLMISLFQIRRKLSESSFSTTFQVYHPQTGYFFCLKVFDKVKIRQQGLEEQIVTEISFRFSHQNVQTQKLFAFFDDEVYVYLVEQYLLGMGGIEQQISTRRRFTERQSAQIFRQAVEAVQFFHGQRFIHRDIRVHNLTRSLGMTKLVDFSWLASLKRRRDRDTFCGASKYAPPELMAGHNYDESIDVWSLGVLLYEISTGYSPFAEGVQERNANAINFPIFLSNELVDLMGKLLSDKKTRIRVPDILGHQWVCKWDADGFVSKQIWDFWVL